MLTFKASTIQMFWKAKPSNGSYRGPYYIIRQKRPAVKQMVFSSISREKVRRADYQPCLLLPEPGAMQGSAEVTRSRPPSRPQAGGDRSQPQGVRRSTAAPEP